MANFFENFNIPPCVWFEGGDKRNALAAILAGFLVCDSPLFLLHDYLSKTNEFSFSLVWVGGLLLTRPACIPMN